MKKVASDPQLTEFDMSVATLMRIDNIIKALHQITIDSAPSTETKELYLKTLDRLYIESSIKMTEDELIRADDYQTTIYLLKQKWGRNLLIPYKNSHNINRAYAQGWSEITFISRDYEIFLMKTMERHNMLLKDQRKVEDSII